ncbi:MAG: hypothetical protein ACRDVL_03370, partial [Acidimicrobiia bacterium]
MDDRHTDLERLTGPDRRSIVPRPGGLGGPVIMIALAIAAGLIALWPRNLPELDLGVIGFAGDTVRAEVGVVARDPCSYAADAECTLVEFLVIEEGAESYGQTPEMEFAVEPSQPELESGDVVF